MSSKKCYGIAFPSECFETEEAAMKCAIDMLKEDEISTGVYVFAATEMVHLKLDKQVVVEVML